MSEKTESIQVTGKVETVLPLETFPSGFSKRVLVINTGGKYPQLVPVEFTKDKTEILSGLTKGQDVTASVNLRGNEYNGKYYASIQGWKLDKGEQQQAKTAAPTNDWVDSAPSEDDFDSIPF